MSTRRSQWNRWHWLRRYVIWPFQAVALAVPLLLLAMLPRRLAAWLGGAITGFAGPRSRQHARAMGRNLAIAFPDLSPPESSDLQRRMWRHFGRVLFTYPHLPPLMRGIKDEGTFEIEGAQHLAEAAKSGSFIMVSAHFGHWEVTCCHAVNAGHRVSGLYTPESNPWIDRVMRYLRGRAGTNLTLVPRGPAAVRQMVESMRSGHALFMIVDQRVDEGEWVPFFGRPAQTTTTPARLARRFDCPILLCRTLVLPKGRYRISYYEPLHPDPAREADADILEMTQSINRAFEAWIREHPEQWLCTKRRWPKDRPHAQPLPPARPSADAQGARSGVAAAVD